MVAAGDPHAPGRTGLRALFAGAANPPVDGRERHMVKIGDLEGRVSEVEYQRLSIKG